MSWSIQKRVGTPEGLRPIVTADFDRAAKMYDGKVEGNDVLAAKASVLAFLDTVPAGQAAIVEATGSRGERWLTISISCSTCELLV